MPLLFAYDINRFSHDVAHFHFVMIQSFQTDRFGKQLRPRSDGFFWPNSIDLDQTALSAPEGAV